MLDGLTTTELGGGGAKAPAPVLEPYAKALPPTNVRPTATVKMTAATAADIFRFMFNLLKFYTPAAQPLAEDWRKSSSVLK